MDKIVNHNEFISAINSKNKVKVIFFSKEDNQNIERTCAPMDYGPSRRSHDQQNKYHFWDYDSDQTSHTLPLVADNISSVAILDEKFDPKSDFKFSIDSTQWFIPRNW
jgi:hypothetical protein